jgi:hypothetical protein
MANGVMDDASFVRMLGVMVEAAENYDTELWTIRVLKGNIRNLSRAQIEKRYMNSARLLRAMFEAENVPDGWQYMVYRDAWYIHFNEYDDDTDFSNTLDIEVKREVHPDSVDYQIALGFAIATAYAKLMFVDGYKLDAEGYEFVAPSAIAASAPAVIPDVVEDAIDAVADAAEDDDDDDDNTLKFFDVDENASPFKTPAPVPTPTFFEQGLNMLNDTINTLVMSPVSPLDQPPPLRTVTPSPTVSRTIDDVDPAVGPESPGVASLARRLVALPIGVISSAVDAVISPGSPVDMSSPASFGGSPSARLERLKRDSVTNPIAETADALPALRPLTPPPVMRTRKGRRVAFEMDYADAASATPIPRAVTAAASDLVPPSPPRSTSTTTIVSGPAPSKRDQWDAETKKAYGKYLRHYRKAKNPRRGRNQDKRLIAEKVYETAGSYRPNRGDFRGQVW